MADWKKSKICTAKICTANREGSRICMVDWEESRKAKDLRAHFCCLQILTKSLAPLPEKWHGLSDAEKRFRQRQGFNQTSCHWDENQTAVRFKLGQPVLRFPSPASGGPPSAMHDHMRARFAGTWT